MSYMEGDIMKQENIELLLVMCVFMIYMMSLSAYSAGCIGVCAFMTGVLFGLARNISICLQHQVFNENNMTYHEVFYQLAAERK